MTDSSDYGLCVCARALARRHRQLDEFRVEIQRRDQEILAMSAKMKTLEEQHQDYQRHIAVLKESLCAKEEHYNMLQADVSIDHPLYVEYLDEPDHPNCLVGGRASSTSRGEEQAH